MNHNFETNILLEEKTRKRLTGSRKKTNETILHFKKHWKKVKLQKGSKHTRL